MRRVDYVTAVDREGNAKAVRGKKIAFMDVTSATNMRTMISAVTGDFPHGNSAPVLKTNGPAEILVSLLNSFTYDFVARARCGGLHLNYFVIDETPLVARGAISIIIVVAAAALAIPATNFAPDWLLLRQDGIGSFVKPWKQYWAITAHERLRLRCITDAIFAELYGLEFSDLAWILKQCDHPIEAIRNKGFYRTLDPKGFWRVDKDKHPELRHTVLALVAFNDLRKTIVEYDGNREAGIKAFSNMNDGDGWQLPETLCLADLDLGHDERAKKPQPVRDCFGPRFLPWQLGQSVEESWVECEVHARNILGEEGFARLQAGLKGEKPPQPSLTFSVAEAAEPYIKAGQQGKLF